MALAEGMHYDRRVDRMRRLHPETPPFDVRMLDVGDGHRLYVEQRGKPSGLPAVYLHGGPGSGCQPLHGQLFDPTVFRVVLPDQRGAGRSTPAGGTTANTTAHLVADLERVRIALGIDRWLIVGGSWGALLAVAYAETYPKRVLGLVLRAVFLGAREEVEWAFHDGPQRFYPDLFRRFADALPETERAQPLWAYGHRLESEDLRLRHGAACLWHDYEQTFSKLAPESLELPLGFDDPSLYGRPTPRTPLMEWHYFKHDCFLKKGALLSAAGALASIPGIIVQGRYDLLCPPRAAFALAQIWRNVQLRIHPSSGHSLAEPGILDGVCAAIESEGRRLA